jgi:hypothetical protein
MFPHGVRSDVSRSISNESLLILLLTSLLLDNHDEHGVVHKHDVGLALLSHAESTTHMMQNAYLLAVGVAGVALHVMLALVDVMILRPSSAPLLLQHQLRVLVGQVTQRHVHGHRGSRRAISGAHALPTRTIRLCHLKNAHFLNHAHATHK